MVSVHDDTLEVIEHRCSIFVFGFDDTDAVSGLALVAIVCQTLRTGIGPYIGSSALVCKRYTDFGDSLGIGGRSKAVCRKCADRSNNICDSSGDVDKMHLTTLARVNITIVAAGGCIGLFAESERNEVVTVVFITDDIVSEGFDVCAVGVVVSWSSVHAGMPEAAVCVDEDACRAAAIAAVYAEVAAILFLKDDGVDCRVNSAVGNIEVIYLGRAESRDVDTAFGPSTGDGNRATGFKIVESPGGKSQNGIRCFIVIVPAINTNLLVGCGYIGGDKFAVENFDIREFEECCG